AIADPAIKAALRTATDHAWASGVSGVPTVRAGGALFYGDDALASAARRTRPGPARGRRQGRPPSRAGGGGPSRPSPAGRRTSLRRGARAARTAPRGGFPR